MQGQWFHKVFSVSEAGFAPLALEIFRFQYTHNPVYRAYVDILNVDIEKIDALSAIPFLPIRLFKTQIVTATSFTADTIFESSGTTETVNSRHYVKDVEFYEQSFLNGFERVYGRINEWCILGLLPSYLERKNSSLVYMVDECIRRSANPQSGFYLYDFERLHSILKNLEAQQQKTLLIGVSFALLDFSEQFALPLRHTTVMETGGMKGRKKEITRAELHGLLKSAFKVSSVHSEYGMTELLSQAYSRSGGIFNCPPWMKVLVRDEEDPFYVTEAGSARGAINVIDLANVYSCSFIATDDAGQLYNNGAFEVFGRLDNSDIRGCSLLSI